ncbi:MAG: hypothetical protein J6Y62_00470 [Clostridia bacterium]|nr:hypothetical protein [Clostridia bacterium]
MSEGLVKKSEAEQMSSMRALKLKLLNEHRRTVPSIAQNLERSAAGYNMDDLLKNIIDDLLLGTEDLKGLELLLEAQGDFKSSGAVLLKRADVLKIIADVVSRQQELHQKAGEVDLNSPVFRMFQKICVVHLMASLDALKVDKEMQSLILKEWQARMGSWDKDLKKAMKEAEEGEEKEGL